MSLKKLVEFPEEYGSFQPAASIVELPAIIVELPASIVEFSAITVEFSAIIVEFSPSVADYSPKWLGTYREVFGQAITNAVFTRDTLT